jgi:small membrane protein
VIFSGLLTLFLLGLIVYALLQKSQFPVIGRALPVVSAVGIYVAWFPDATSKWAHLVGIGRGVDLMLYVWILASGLLFLVLHLKLVAQQRQLTELARYMAIAGAERPASPPAQPTFDEALQVP